MTRPSPLFRRHRRFAALATTLAVHLALLYGWLSDRVNVDNGIEVGSRIQWLLVPKPEPATVPRPQVSRNVAITPPPRLPAAPALQREAVQPAPSGLPFEEELAPAPVMSMMDRARGAVRGIDRELQEANKDKLIRAKPVSTQMRLERAMQRAHDLAPNKWYQASKVTEIIEPGGYGRRLYRVVGPHGTYCVTYESNHAPDGIDSMHRGIKPKNMTCPQE